MYGGGNSNIHNEYSESVLVLFCLNVHSCVIHLERLTSAFIDFNSYLISSMLWRSIFECKAKVDFHCVQ
jgi:hypothetical protein